MENYTMEGAIKKSIKIPPIDYQYHGEEFLTVKRDISYYSNHSIEQTFDIYYPKDFKPFQHKTVLFVNGFDFANDDEYTREIIDKTLEFIRN